MLTNELIERGGSKLEATRLFLEEGLDIPIPDSIFWYGGQSLDTIRADFERLSKPVIVRGSHRNDWHGMVGAIPTIRDVYAFEHLEEAITEIEEAMRSEDMKRFAADEGFGYTEEVHALIQAQSPSNFRGSMIRHPNQPDLLLMRYCDFLNHRNDNPMRDSISSAEYHEDVQEISHYCGISGRKSKFSDEDMFEIIEMYKTIENSGLLKDNWAYHMEFGLRPAQFFQIRPFKQIQEADFSIYDLDIDCPHLEIWHTIGITPREGIELPLAVVSSDELWFSTHEEPVCDITQPYGVLIKRSGWSDDVPITIPVGNMRAYVTGAGQIDLFHGAYRFMKRAEIFGSGYYAQGLGPCLALTGLPRSLVNYRGPARVISDGESGILIPDEKYL